MSNSLESLCREQIDQIVELNHQHLNDDEFLSQCNHESNKVELIFRDFVSSLERLRQYNDTRFNALQCVIQEKELAHVESEKLRIALRALEESRDKESKSTLARDAEYMCRLEQLHHQRTVLKDKIENLNHHLHNAEHRCARMQAQTDELQIQNKRLAEQCQELVQHNRSLRKSNLHLSSNVDKMQRKIEEIHLKCEIGKEKQIVEMKRVEDELRRCRKENEILDKSVKDSEKRAENAQQVLDRQIIGKRKQQKNHENLVNKMHRQEEQIRLLTSNINKLQSFFHNVESLDANDKSNGGLGKGTGFRFRKIVQHLDQLRDCVGEL